VRRIRRNTANRVYSAFRNFGILSFSFYLTLFELIDYGKDILTRIRPFVNRKSPERIRQQRFILKYRQIKVSAGACEAIILDAPRFGEFSIEPAPAPSSNFFF